MFCQRCGKYVPEGKENCVYCGGPLGEKQTVQPRKITRESKAWVGILWALFFGLMGLFMGVCVFSGYEKETFLSGWIKFYVIRLIIMVILGVMFGIVFSLLSRRI